MKKILIPILILEIAVIGFVYLLKTKPEGKRKQEQEIVWVVSTIPAKLSRLSPTVTLYGRAESPRTTTLRAPAQSANAVAQVEEVAVLEGETVKKGQTLIRLDDKDSQLNLEQREADIAEIQSLVDLENQNYANSTAAVVHEENLLKLTKDSLERFRTLKNQQLGSQAALDEVQQGVERQSLNLSNRRLEIKNHPKRLAQLEAKLDRARAQRELARLEVARTQVQAPFSGMITKVSVSVGDRVRSGDALLSLYDTTTLEIRAQIPSRYQDIVLNVLATDYPLAAQAQVNNTSIELQLDRVSGEINRNSGGIDGIFHLTKGKELLRLGQFLTMFMNLPEQQSVVALPFEAVYGSNRIYKLVDNRMKGLTVERIGEQRTTTGKSYILIRSSELQEGNPIVTTQLPNAMEGLKVLVR